MMLNARRPLMNLTRIIFIYIKAKKHAMRSRIYVILCANRNSIGYKSTRIELIHPTLEYTQTIFKGKRKITSIMWIN